MWSATMRSHFTVSLGRSSSSWRVVRSCTQRRGTPLSNSSTASVGLSEDGIAGLFHGQAARGGGVQDSFRTSTDKITFRKVHPTNCAVSIQQKLGGTRDVGFVGGACVRMDEIPLANDLQLFITKKQERVASRLAEIFGFAWAVDINCDHANPA